MNALYVDAGAQLESVLDERQVEAKDKRVGLAQDTLLGVTCTFEAEATLGEFTSCLRHVTHFLPTATNLNPAAPWQLAVYAADLQLYEAAHERYGGRAELPKEQAEAVFQQAMAASKDFETRGVAWRYNQIWDSIWVAECVLS